MREHLGVDVDSMYEEDLNAAKSRRPAYDQQLRDPDEGEKGEHGVIYAKETKGGLESSRVVGQGMPLRALADTPSR